MRKKHWNKLKRVAFKALPSSNDMSLFVKGLILVIIGITGMMMFSYVSTAKAQVSNSSDYEDAFSGVLAKLGQDAPGGCVALYGFSSAPDRDFSAAASTGGFGRSDIEKCSGTKAALSSTNTPTGDEVNSINSPIAEVDYGATGRLLNAGTSVYDVNLTQPGTTMVYYADNIRGTAHAADNPTSGRSFLAPIFFLNQAMVNLAYGLVVVLLLFAALNILISSLTGAEEKFTLVQLLINAGVTLLVVTFYYEISAIIYDLTVNYGNALAASVLSPYINAQVILERLQPGGDLSVVMLLNTFEFAGVTDSFLVVAQSVASGLYPAVAQSTGTLSNIFGPLIGTGQIASGSWLAGLANFFGFAGGVSSVGIGYVASTFLGSKQVFESIIAWTIFLINLKIFFNLLSTAVTYSVMTAFGPLMALGGMTGGFEKIRESFTTLLALGAVFPGTFTAILLAATTMNMFIRRDVNAAEVDTGSVLCKYSPGDPTSTAESIIDRGGVVNTGQKLIGGDITTEDPKEFRIKNYINQRIYDVTPASSVGGVRNCRSSLFQTPFTFIPAPFGTLGNRALQIQLIDSLVRTFLAIAFLLIASRMPAIINEAMGVKDFGPIKGIGKIFTKGAGTFFSVGGTALSLGLPIATGLANSTQSFVGRRILRGRPFSSAAKGIDTWKTNRDVNAGRLESYQQAVTDPVTGNTTNETFYRPGKNFKPQSSLGDVFDALKNRSSAYGTAAASRQMSSGSTMFQGMGVSAADANLLAGQQVIQNFDKLTKQMNGFGNAMQAATGIVDNLTKQMGGLANEIGKLLILDID